MSSSSEEMIVELYAELRRLASAKLRKLPPGQTLQPTALVHEAYLRLAGQGSQRWANRSHFFASAAESMRRILVDQARRKAAQRRPPGALQQPLDRMELAAPEPEERLLAVHEVLDELERLHPSQAQIVKLRFFAGLKHEEIAALLAISEKTARRQWNEAKLWLYEKIENRKETSKYAAKNSF
jgi:RNA polymerase sigma factor (TIGR02999 family)